MLTLTGQSRTHVAHRQHAIAVLGSDSTGNKGPKLVSTVLVPADLYGFDVSDSQSVSAGVEEDEVGVDHEGDA